MKTTTIWLAALAGLATGTHAASDGLAELSLEELVKTEITSVSRKSQSLTDVAAAAFVISAEDIRRSGAQSLPDILRMAPGVEVSQIDNGRYAVSVRGFNGRFANKLQVLVDGRSLYHPMFSGVLWELDPVPLDDIERIEIIRGAAGVMWGANAVSGLINIITRHTRNQAGAAVNVSAGNKGTGNLYARIGQATEDGSSWKLSFQGRHIEPSQLGRSGDSADRLNNGVVDFRLDRDLSGGSDLTLWANASRSRITEFWEGIPSYINNTLAAYDLMPRQELHSESLMGRYRWLGESGVESSVQASLTRSGIDITNFVHESRSILDIDYQARYAYGRHDILWGLAHRTTRDHFGPNEPYVTGESASATLQKTGLYVHDDWMLVPEKLKFSLGLRADKATRNGTNVSANSSLLWTPTRSDSIWAKYGQAPRTSSRGERDISIFSGYSVLQTRSPVFPFPVINVPVVARSIANPNGYGSEQAKGLELGYRKQFSNAFSADINAYRYRYTDLRSSRYLRTYGCNALFALTPAGYNPAACSALSLDTAPVMVAELQIDNALSGWSQGIELSADWLVMPNWRLQFSYTVSRLKIDGNSDAARMNELAAPRHYGSLRSQWNISPDHQFDLWLRGSSGLDLRNGIDKVPSPTGGITFSHVPGYVTLDLRYAYRLNKDLEFSLIGRNLIGGSRVEYISDYIPTAATKVSPTWLVGTRWNF